MSVSLCRHTHTRKYHRRCLLLRVDLLRIHAVAAGIPPDQKHHQTACGYSNSNLLAPEMPWVERTFHPVQWCGMLQIHQQWWRLWLLLVKEASLRWSVSCIWVLIILSSESLFSSSFTRSDFATGTLRVGACTGVTEGSNRPTQYA